MLKLKLQYFAHLLRTANSLEKTPMLGKFEGRKRKWKSLSLVRLLSDSMDYIFLQARILEWVAFPFSRGSSQPRDWTHVSRIAGRFFTTWAIREGDDKGWTDWMSSPTQRTWVWANSSSWWRTGKSGVLQSMRLQRIRHKWATEEHKKTVPLQVSLSMGFLRQEYWKWVAISFSREFSPPRNGTRVSCIGRQIFFYHWATREA